MTTPRMITAEWLEENKACADAINLFCAEWPDGGEVTQENLVRADALRLNLEWFAKRALPPQVYAECQAQRDTLYADYRDKRDALYADFQAKRAALMHADYEGCRVLMLYADNQAQRAALFAEFQAKIAAQHADFVNNRDATYADYHSNGAALFAEFQAKIAALIIPILLNRFAAQTINASDKATTISVTYEEIADKGVWVEFCELTGISEWARNEGQIPEGEEFLLTENQARELGFL